jgi:hypothetical protein
MQVNTSIRLERVEELPDGSITAYFSDNPAAGLSFGSQQDMNTFLSNAELWLPTLKAMLLLDWSQETIVGKTAVLSCSDPNDYWVTAS